MKILIIGGAGFVSTHLRPLLEADGHVVECSDNFSGSLLHRVPGGLAMHKADASNHNSMSYVFDKVRPDVVFLGVGHHYSRDVRYNFFKEGESITNAANVLSSLITPSVKHVFYFSHSDVYGGPETSRPLTEDRKIVLSTNYRGASNLAAEGLLASRCFETGTKLSILRLFDIVGPRVVFNPANCRVNFLVDSFIRKELVGLVGADKKRDFLHVDDAVAAVNALFKAGVVGTFNIGSGRGVTLRSLVKELGKHIPVTHAPREVPDVYRPSYSAVADIRALQAAVPGWEPKVDVFNYLPELVEFRRKETAYYSAENRPNVLADQRRGSK